MILKEKVTEFILSQPEFKSSLKNLATAIRNKAQAATNEATIAHQFEILLYSFLKEKFGIEFMPEKEVPIGTQRHTGKGRMDSRLGALIIEYKFKTKLASKTDQVAATKQIIDYMQTLVSETGHEIVGLVTDGLKAKFLNLDSCEILTETAFEDLSDAHLDRLIRSIVLLEKTALTPENLVKDFCAEGGVAKQLAVTLYDALENHITPRSQMLFNEWQALFKLAHDDVSKQKAIQERREALAVALNITIKSGDNVTEYRALYAIQTAYAIILKIIAYKVIGTVRSHDTLMHFSELTRAASSAIRSNLYNLEEGAIFREIGFGNLLEGDFFAWYCTDKQ